MSPAEDSTTILLLGTCDTKLQELLFLRDQIRDQDSAEAIFLDVGRDNVEHEAINITQATLVTKHGDGKTTADLPRGEVIKFMAGCACRAVKQLFEEGKIHGVISAGGSGGTSLAGNTSPVVIETSLPERTVQQLLLKHQFIPFINRFASPRRNVSLTISQPR